MGEDEDDFNREFDISDEELDALNMERTVLDLDHEAQVRRLIKEAGPRVTLSLIKLATAGHNENARINASKYLLDKLLDPNAAGSGGVLEDLVADLAKQAEQYANNG